MTRTDWLIAAREWTTQTITIDGGPQDVTAPNGALYLLHTTPALDLLARVVVAMTAAGVADPAAYVTEDRHVRLTSSGVFTITWGLGTTLRDLLGFGGDLAGQSAYTATSRSTLLWSPGLTMTPELAPLRSHGQPHIDASWTIGPQGVGTLRVEGAPTIKQRFTGVHVPKDRYHASPPATVAGDFAHWWEQELTRLRKWIVLAPVLEGSSNTTSADYSSSTIVGPYIVDMSEADIRRLPFRRAPGFESREGFYSFTVPAVKTAEYS